VRPSAFHRAFWSSIDNVQTEAAIYAEIGRPMIIDQVDLPEPGPTQVLVRYAASGICHSQLHTLRRSTTPVPTVMGHEAAGTVVSVGSQVTSVREGDRFVTGIVQRNPANPFQPIPANPMWHGQILNFGGPAYTGVYTWSREAVLDEQMLFKITDSIPSDLAAVIGCAVLTGCGAAKNAAQVRPGNSVAIFGVGGVGLCVVQACANLGAFPIIAVDVSDEKLEYAKQFGATVGINSRRQDPIAEIRHLTGGEDISGVDFAFDAIGATQTIELVLLAARAKLRYERDGGIAVIVGVPHGTQAAPRMELIMQGKAYRGAPAGCGWPERDYPIYLHWYKKGTLPLEKLISARFKLEEINEACAALEHGEIAGRAIIEY
jgi:Zn-dependent alcohol dehydrogenase